MIKFEQTFYLCCQQYLPPHSAFLEHLGPAFVIAAHCEELVAALVSLLGASLVDPEDKGRGFASVDSMVDGLHTCVFTDQFD